MASLRCLARSRSHSGPMPFISLPYSLFPCCPSFRTHIQYQLSQSKPAAKPFTPPASYNPSAKPRPSALHSRPDYCLLYSIRAASFPSKNQRQSNKQKSYNSSQLRAGLEQSLLHLRRPFHSHSSLSITSTLAEGNSNDTCTTTNPSRPATPPQASSPPVDTTPPDNRSAPTPPSASNNLLTIAMGATRENRADSGVSCPGTTDQPRSNKAATPKPKPVIHHNKEPMPKEDVSTKVTKSDVYR